MFGNIWYGGLILKLLFPIFVVYGLFMNFLCDGDSLIEENMVVDC